MDEFKVAKPGKRKRAIVSAGAWFFVSLFVILLTLLSVWLLGLGQHRTLFINALLSTSILSASFLVFLTTGLYRGFKLKDDLGRITDKIRWWKIPNLKSSAPKKRRQNDSSGGSDLSGCVGDGCLDAFDDVFLWLLAAVIAVVLLWFLGNMFWALILIFAAMLYWIFFRALRLVFRKSFQCKGHFFKSLGYALFYTALYNCWIYGIILGIRYLIH